MDYKIWQPRDILSSVVKCYWTLQSPAESIPQKQRIVPDGCMEMVFQCGDVYRQHLPNGNMITQPRWFVFGQITRHLDIEPTGLTDIFSVRFLPDGFNPLATIPVRQMENRAVPLEELFGEDGKNIGTTILNAGSAEERITLVEEFILGRLVRPETVDEIVRATVELMLKINGKGSVNDLTGTLSVNRRLLERRFSSVIGLSPKQLSKIIRLQSALSMLINNRFTSFTALAYEGEYYDQAHFTKNFREFTGVNPGRFFADNLKMSALFYGGE